MEGFAMVLTILGAATLAYGMMEAFEAMERHK